MELFFYILDFPFGERNFQIISWNQNDCNQCVDEWHVGIHVAIIVCILGEGVGELVGDCLDVDLAVSDYHVLR